MNIKESKFTSERVNDIIKDVIVNCLGNLMINRITGKDKKQLEVRMQEKQIKNDKLGNIYKELINIVNTIGLCYESI